MRWSGALIKVRLHYWGNYREYVRMWQPREEYIGVPKRKRVSFDPLFVSQALENYNFDFAFGKLTEQEQEFLVMLYTDGAEDLSRGDDIKIAHSEKGFDSLMKTHSPKEIWEIVNGALKSMVDQLNKLEQIIV